MLDLTTFTCFPLPNIHSSKRREKINLNFPTYGVDTLRNIVEPLQITLYISEILKM